MTVSPGELRRYPRIHVDVEVNVCTADGRKLVARTRDLSRSGICVITTDPWRQVKSSLSTSSSCWGRARRPNPCRCEPAWSGARRLRNPFKSAPCSTGCQPSKLPSSTCSFAISTDRSCPLERKWKRSVMTSKPPPPTRTARPHPRPMRRTIRFARERGAPLPAARKNGLSNARAIDGRADNPAGVARALARWEESRQRR